MYATRRRLRQREVTGYRTEMATRDELRIRALEAEVAALWERTEAVGPRLVLLLSSGAVGFLIGFALGGLS